MFRGTGASPGIAIGKAFLIEKEEIKIEQRSIQDIDFEINRFNTALEESKKQIEMIRQKGSIEQKKILEAHIMILEDPELIKSVEAKIKTEKINVEAVLKEVLDMFINIFEGMDDEYMRERGADIRDVGQRLMSNLLGKEQVSLDSLVENVILVAHDITPSDTAQMNPNRVLGFLTDIGGRTSHSAIMARTMEIPAVVGLGDITDQVKTGDMLVLDGSQGKVFVNPDEEIIKAYLETQRKEQEEKEELRALIDSETITKDGKKVELGCNIGNPKDAKKASEKGAEGIGLYRTEFLYMDRDTLPNEEEQFNAYKEVLEIMGTSPVVIRTLDIGGDKELPYLKLPKEMNPFLGYRAIRICLDKKDIFKTQLRALLRASIYGNLKIMYPMISSVEEVREANDILEEVKAQLSREGIEISPSIEIGIMIEIPSAAVISDLLAKEVDFFSIGTNDLIQYTTAVDRMNEKISYLYNPFNPAVLRLIKSVIDNGHREGIWVGMCGEVAGDPRLIPILIGMGLDEFSMSAGALLAARKQIRTLSYQESHELAQGALKLSTAVEIEQYIENYYQ